LRRGLSARPPLTRTGWRREDVGKRRAQDFFCGENRFGFMVHTHPYFACAEWRPVRLDVANRQGVLGGSWTRLGSEAPWTSQMPCHRVAIGLKGASEALLLLSGGKPGHAATSTRGPRFVTLTPRVSEASTRGPRFVTLTPRVSEAPQEGSRRLSWALRHSAFTCF
jgi:hypothetical protein